MDTTIAASTAQTTSLTALNKPDTAADHGGQSFMDIVFAQIKAQKSHAAAQDARRESDQASTKTAAENSARAAAKVSARSAANAKADAKAAAAADARNAQANAKANEQAEARASAREDADNDAADATMKSASDASAASKTAGDDGTLSSATMTVADLEKLMKQAAAQLDADDKGASADGKNDSADGETDAKGNLTLAMLSPEGKAKLLAVLQNLLKGTPAGQQPTVETLENGVLKKLDMNDLTADAAAKSGDSTLIVSGLTPQQLSDIIKKLEDGDKDDPAAASAAGSLMIGIVQVNPVDIKKEAIFQPRSSILPAPGAGSPAAGDIAADKGAGPAGDDTELSSLSALTGASDKSAGKAEGGFEKVLRILESARQHDGNAQGTLSNADKNAAKAVDITAGNSVLPANGQTAAAGDISASLSPDGTFSEGLDLTAARMGASLNLTGAAPASNLITSAPQAIYPHPATQQVATALVKTTNSGNGSTALSLRLDPPELGKISIRLEFNKEDKTVKAVIAAEKPETYLLLQRDSHVLHQSLKDAGLDPGAAGLSFQLSQDGSLFGQNNEGRHGNNQPGKNGASSGDDEMTIETKMDWSVDSTTGTMHYNILA